jgi:hypothetical protein
VDEGEAVGNLKGPNMTLNQCRLSPKPTLLTKLSNHSFIRICTRACTHAHTHTHSTSECNEQNTLNLELVLFPLKHKGSAKQLSITYFFGKK